MTVTAALLVLLLGILIGYRLQRIVSQLRARYRRATYKPTVLRKLAIEPDPEVDEP